MIEARRSPLASGSLAEHLLRGAVGIAAAILAIALSRQTGAASLGLLAVTLLAWRGCPTCWAVGLMGTMADRRTSNHRADCAATGRCHPRTRTHATGPAAQA